MTTEQEKTQKYRTLKYLKTAWHALNTATVQSPEEFRSQIEELACQAGNIFDKIRESLEDNTPS